MENSPCLMSMVFLVEKATLDDLSEINAAFQEIYQKEVKLPLKRILKIWFMRKLRMSGLSTAGVSIDKGEVFEVLEANHLLVYFLSVVSSACGVKPVTRRIVWRG